MFIIGGQWVLSGRSQKWWCSQGISRAIANLAMAQGLPQVRISPNLLGLRTLCLSLPYSFTFLPFGHQDWGRGMEMSL